VFGVAEHVFVGAVAVQCSTRAVCAGGEISRLVRMNE
jgi:hypothetical protein